MRLTVAGLGACLQLATQGRVEFEVFRKVHIALSYGWERFHLALRGLAIGDIPLRERIGNAFAYRRQHVQAEDLPDDIAAQIAEENHRRGD